MDSVNFMDSINLIVQSKKSVLQTDIQILQEGTSYFYLFDFFSAIRY